MDNLKQKVKKFLYNLNYKILMRNVILLESSPDFSDNTRGFYDELIKEGYNKKYKIVWVLNSSKNFKDIKTKNVKFIQRKNKIIFYYYNIFSKYIVDCNNFVNKYNKNQKRIHLTHGATIKVTTDYCSMVGNIDYLVQIGNFFTDINSKMFKAKKEQIITTGFPRNDILLNNKEVFLPEIKRKKTILWLPTYRKHKNNPSSKNAQLKYGVPIIKTEQEIIKLNEVLKENDILLLIKLHPAEDTTNIKSLELSNIKLITNDIFEKNHLTLYHFLNSTDALITDYSSIYYDYLLTRKPIALAIDDLKEFSHNNELLFDNFEENIIGFYLYKFNDLINFIKNIGDNIDLEKDKRLKIIEKYFKYDDDQSAKRIIKYLELK